ncbi:MAG: hypothetical protein EOM19_01370 [Candidatus Moranbacteria bacterium]|nr:hypothetical protein [Candidatus Moranbacteria bacterium]
MRFEEKFSPEENKESLERMRKIITRITQSNLDDLHPGILEYFEDEDLAKEFFQKFRDDAMEEYIIHSCKFANFIPQARNINTGFFGKEEIIPETKHDDGRIRPKEKGRTLDLDVLKKNGIDPQNVLFFRVTQPVKEDEIKPEYYWTSNYFEAKNGLQQEIPLDLRATSIILVADLEAISKNGGLIEDMNDCGGLSVRQGSSESFDQNRALVQLRKK